MNKFSTTNIIAGNKKVDLMAKDKSNKYLFSKIEESLCKRFIVFSVYSTTEEIPFENDDGIKIRNGIFDYYIGEITVSSKHLSDNNYWNFINRRYQ